MANYLKENRKELKIQQKKIAEMCSVRVQTVQNWEKGQAIPSDKLELLAAHGFDVLYIVTGKHSPPIADNSLDTRISRLNSAQQDVLTSMLHEMEESNNRETRAHEAALRALGREK